MDLTDELLDLVSQLAETLCMVADATGDDRAFRWAELAAKKAQALIERYDSMPEAPEGGAITPELLGDMVAMTGWTEEDLTEFARWRMPWLLRE